MSSNLLFVVPKGHVDNSPTIYRWGDEFDVAKVPKGRTNRSQTSFLITGSLRVAGEIPEPSALAFGNWIIPQITLRIRRSITEA